MINSTQALVLTSAKTIPLIAKEKCIQILQNTKFEILGENILGQNALEILFCGDISNCIGQIKSQLDNMGIDANALPIMGRQKKLLIADMDATIITTECVDELATLHGVSSQVKILTDKAMQGILNFEASLRARVSLLEGLPFSSIEEAYHKHIKLTEGACTLVQTMNQNGAVTILATGGFTCFAEPIAKRVGFQHYRANQLEIKHQRLTGRITPPILGKESKESILIEFMEKHNGTISNTLAVGDGANDSAMISAASLGVAFHAKPALKKETNIHINHSDLTALLYLQGYREDEFVSSV
ncbi:phosphoserine phosphatase SerB [Kiloniella antarctica]|uniref:Phosphoserine phosphatase n=1 Tax=Kiloniella antarctica TaxID=1550907 RepID=A0ABW5BM83_9PROT